MEKEVVSFRMNSMEAPLVGDTGIETVKSSTKKATRVYLFLCTRQTTWK